MKKGGADQRRFLCEGVVGDIRVCYNISTKRNGGVLMIKFIKRNKIISAFGAIAVLISVSYAITYNMPDYFGIESWYSLFNNISISYIALYLSYN